MATLWFTNSYTFLHSKFFVTLRVSFCFRILREIVQIRRWKHNQNSV